MLPRSPSRATMVKIPNADKAIIAQDKLCDYLLNVAHRRGGSKAKLLLAMGHSADDWQRLEADIRHHHLQADVACEAESDYGQRYEIVASLPGPSGPTVMFRRSILEQTIRA